MPRSGFTHIVVQDLANGAAGSLRVPISASPLLR
jgi:hypothetical protein